MNTHGKDWNCNEGWLPLETLRTECCRRNVYGVTCNEEGRVNSTMLLGNNLVGVIPGSIGNLSELVEL